MKLLETGKKGAAAIIQAKFSDLQTVLSLVRAYYKVDRIPFRMPAIRSGLEKLLHNPSIGRVYLIRLGRRYIGYLVLTFGYDLEFGGRQATITDFYIAGRCRRIGLGSAAARFVEETCRKLGIGALELQVERHNEAARSFYCRLGFKSHDRVPMSKYFPPRTADLQVRPA